MTKPLPPHKDSPLNQEDELSRLRDLERVILTTEKLAKIGHYEWDWNRDCLASCSEEYARIFDMTLPQVMAAQNSWENTLKHIVPEDVERYIQAAGVMSNRSTSDVSYRIQLDDNTIKHIRETSIVVKDSTKSGNSSLGILQDITEQVEREQELGYRDELARQVESITDIGHFIYDEVNANYTYLSEGWARIFDTTIDDYMANVQSLSDDLLDIHPDDRQRVDSEYRHYRETGEECSIEYRIIRSDGQIRWLRELGRARIVEDGKALQTLGVVQDITMRVNREQALMFNATIVSEVEAIADIGYFLFDEKLNRNIIISPGQARIVGLDVDAYYKKIITNEDYIKLVYEEDQALVRKAYFSDLHEDGQWKVEYRVLKPDGELCWILETGKAFKRSETGVEQSIGLLRDITKQKNIEQELRRSKDTLEHQVAERTRELSNTVKQLQEQIEERKKVEAELDFLANHDALTGLPSLRLSKDRLEHSLASARRSGQMAAVMFLDLDGFKNINDTLGHETGDQVLISTAKRIQKEIRETDTVARIGGDEFIIILSNVSEILVVKSIADNLITQIALPMADDKKNVFVSASIGIALYPEHGAKSDQLMRAADKAMYEVKKSGKNNFGFANASELETVLSIEKTKENQAS